MRIWRAIRSRFKPDEVEFRAFKAPLGALQCRECGLPVEMVEIHDRGNWDIKCHPCGHVVDASWALDEEIR